MVQLVENHHNCYKEIYYNTLHFPHHLRAHPMPRKSPSCSSAFSQPVPFFCPRQWSWHCREGHQVKTQHHPNQPQPLGAFFARNSRSPMLQNLLYFLIIPLPLLLFMMMTKLALSFVAFLALAVFLKILLGD